MWVEFGNSVAHLNMVKGDYIFREWEDNAWKDFNKQVNELRSQGYRKIDQEHAMNGDYFEYYRKRKKGKKNFATVTMMCV